MKLVIPKQHGAWAMLVIPFLLNMFASHPKWGHLFLFFAWLFFYLATYSFLQMIKLRKQNLYMKSFIHFFIFALLFVSVPLFNEPALFYFGLSLLPLFCINVYYTKTKNERAFLNDVIAIINFGIGGLASFYYGAHTIDETATLLFSLHFFYFFGTILYVKTMIREKRNIRYKYYSWVYHVGIVFVLLLFQHYAFALAFLPSAVRAIVLYGKKIAMKTLGMVEILNAVYFFFIIIIFGV